MGANCGMAGWYSSIEQYKYRIYTSNNIITTTNSIKYTKMHLVKAVMCFFCPYWLAGNRGWSCCDIEFAACHYDEG